MYNILSLHIGQAFVDGCMTAGWAIPLHSNDV
jgi:hypothetical protein